jgi:hypothetical protein
MSSSRKRSAIKKAQEETANVKQKLMMTEHHYNCIKQMVELIAKQHDEKLLEIYELKSKYCPETMTDTEKFAHKVMLEKAKKPEQLDQGVPT